MKRSHINDAVRRAKDFFAAHQFILPPLAEWSLADWKKRGETTVYLRRRGLGWDVTDFGSGRFEQCGLLLFTIRNGLPDDPEKVFAEKIMIVRQNQLAPRHFHFRKTEDIINRGGGRLVVELHRSGEDGALADGAIRVRCDGIMREVKSGGRTILEPGESITLVPGVYHSFYAEGADALIGEVSSVNDDTKDNRFYEALPRVAPVEEDEAPVHWLCTDYARLEKLLHE